MAKISNDWLQVLEPEFSKAYYSSLYSFVKKEYAIRTIYPSKDDLFNAYHLTPFNSVKVVILGNQPYSKEGQADGLAYSAKMVKRLPKQLENIYKELNEDVGCYVPENGDLTKWAKQGVLLLNCVLTVRDNAPSSHKGKGWEEFTDATLRALNEQCRPIVYLLWGKEAESKKRLFTNPRQCVLTAAHPSQTTVNQGFFGCKHFSKANEFLVANGVRPIDWQIEA